MKTSKINIPGLFLINTKPFLDHRGVFLKIFNKDAYKKNKLNYKISDINLSTSLKKYTLRGMHYQTGKFSETKTIHCIKGSIYDVILDLRKNSPTFKKWTSFIIKNNNYMIQIPAGCAHGFLTLEKNTTVIYFSSKKHNPKYEKVIRYDDPSFKIKWPKKPTSISKKDSLVSTSYNT
jgi:dTDP-4-dehydrorhamnose 3,5-epimerase